MGTLLEALVPGRTESRRLAKLLWFVLLLGWVAAIFSPALASGALTHPYEESFGPDGSEATTFSRAVGVTVDQQTGDIFVGDSSAETISKFGGDHQPSDFTALGSNEIVGISSFTGPGESQLAVDSSSHRIFATARNSLLAFEANGEPAEFSALTSTEIGGFSELCGVAVDLDGNIYTGDFSNGVSVFAPNGELLTSISTARVCNVAVDSSGAVYVDHYGSTIEKFTPSIFPVTPLTTYSSAGIVDPGEAYSLAINPSNDALYVDHLTSISQYAGGTLEGTFGDTGLGALSVSGGIAVSGSGNSERIYVSDIEGQKRVEIFGAAVVLPDVVTEAASPVGATNATLHGSVNPNGVPLTECFFEWGETDSYGEIAPCDAPDAGEVGEGNSPILVHADIAELKTGTEYHFRFVAGNANNPSGEPSRGDDKEFLTLGATIRDENASEITATEASISGQINPNGEETTLVVQYVTAAQFEASGYTEAVQVPTPPRELGAGTSFVTVNQRLFGLFPDTTYHFRFVATNAAGIAVGSDRTFTTFLPANVSLPDGRVYEMVTPPQKSGEVLPPEPFQALGGRFTSTCPIECLPGGNAGQMPMQSAPGGGALLFEGQPFSGGLASGANEYLSRRDASGWKTQSLTSPVFETKGTQGYKGFSADLALGVQLQVEPALSPAAPQREGKSFANLYLVPSDGGLPQPLITVEPPNRDPQPGATGFRTLFSGANPGTQFAPAFSHTVFEANDALTDATAVAPAAVDGGVEESEGLPINLNLYEWFEGELRLVNVLPGNTETSPGAVLGSGRELAAVFSPAESPDVDNAISEDGSRIFWSDEGTGQVYVRISGQETVEVGNAGKFVVAAVDGSKVLLSDGCIYDLEEEECEDVTLDESEVHQGGFEGILGAADDLSRVYFVDTAALTDENVEHKSPVEGENNLYLWEEGITSFVGTLLSGANGDNRFGSFGAWRAPSANRLAQVSPDGRYLAFMSKARLTGYNNEVRDSAECKGQRAGGTTCFEVFEYDAVSKQLQCASCNPSGQRPLGQSNLSLISPFPSYPIVRQLENLPADGEGLLFFESQDELTSRDTNGGIQDVYEWKPEGVRGCERSAGCVDLISSGHASGDSMFLDSTPSGDDVFFITRDRLLPQDKDDLLDVYDARVGGGFVEGPAAPCTGKGCKGPIPSPPTLPLPGSSVFQGSGNPPRPRACKRGFVRKHGKCVKKKHKQRHKSTTQNRRGPR